jgi:glycosyltransferase involved in cell wall biosynthesis
MRAKTPSPAPHILMLVGDTITRGRRTGIHRVTIETARGLAEAARLDLVRWDWLEGRLRFLDMDEIDRLFGAGDWPEGVRVNPMARRIGRPFREQLDHPEATWLLIPEVGWHEANGIESIGRAIAHCRDWGGRSAAIFYDLIPVRNPVYAGGAENHEAYLTELTHADLIIPISATAGADLEALWRERQVTPHPLIAPLLLPDGGFGARGGAPAAVRTGAPSRRIALIGTVEPRKRQLDVLKALERARGRSPEVARWTVTVVGSVHGFVADEFNALTRRASSWLTHLDYASDETVRQVIREADFTAFASDDEGYGLPIAESLAFGTPCLCAGFGSMGEIARGGGCLTVDVRDPAALEEALIRLCENPALVEALRAEIAARPFQSWADYGRGLLRLLQTHAPGPRLAVASVQSAPAASALDAAAFERLARADVVGFSGADERRAFIDHAQEAGWPALLPTLLPAGEAVTQAAEALTRDKHARARLAEVERAYARARQSAPPQFKTRQAFLRILISTFNRREFVVMNVLWILKEILPKDDHSIELMVVDGGSTDGTLEALDGIKDPRLQVYESPTNVGMLAGLREAARLPGAEYIWLIGDDDLIKPEGFKAILAGLRQNRGAPFGFTNFSVYYRKALTDGDRAYLLIMGAHPVGADIAPTGLLKVRQAAEQTDNLFTAIYTVIWRADLLSAAYEHAFDGEPFIDLTQAIPCTEYILGRYGECDAFWHGAVGIAGNGSNSWSRHKPRWHGAIMPLAFQLARDAGVDPVRLQTWADLHRAWLEDALAEARAEGRDALLRPADRPLAEAVFRGALPDAFDA